MEGYEPKIDTLAKECGYKNRDTINCSKVGLGEVRGGNMSRFCRDGDEGFTRCMRTRSRVSSKSE